DMPQGEWIELYNNSDIAVDLTGWYIKDSADHIINITSLNTNPATTIISANNWLVVYMNKAFLNNVTGSNIEEIKLYNSLNELQDETSYTSSNDHCDLEPTPGEENDETGSGTCSGVPPNKSYARIPDGVGAWVDPIPTPGGTNSIQEQAVIPNDL
ncbi:lamin tail domain-containing protein, partial [Patescibacteria group bacterium]|nr:lamin tail domain-containing protein [Patescibacteria group bacterium]